MPIQISKALIDFFDLMAAVTERFQMVLKQTSSVQQPPRNDTHYSFHSILQSVLSEYAADEHANRVTGLLRPFQQIVNNRLGLPVTSNQIHCQR